MASSEVFLSRTLVLLARPVLAALVLATLTVALEATGVTTQVKARAVVQPVQMASLAATPSTALLRAITVAKRQVYSHSDPILRVKVEQIC